MHAIGTQPTKFLTKQHIQDDAYYKITIDYIKANLKSGDVVLVEGQSPASNTTQFITSFNWSHAAIYIGKRGHLSIIIRYT